MSSRELRTQRLLLRPFRSDDADAFEAFASDPAYRRYLGPHHPTPAEFVANNLKIDWEREFSWVVCFEDEPVGSIFLGVDPNDRFAELACMLAASVWRNHIASEAGQAVIAYAFDTLQLEKVVARAAAGNIASRSAMERAGMVQEGVLRSHRVDYDGQRVDEVLYGLTVDDWRRLRTEQSRSATNGG
jgi:RimJ/RimL family protein N-acetyltransferase